MAKGFRSSTARLSAALHKRAKVARQPGPEEAHARNVLAITKRIHAREAERRALNAKVKKLGLDLRRDRRELRAVLQRDSSYNTDSATAGGADAIDAMVANEEARIEDGQARWSETGSTKRR